MKTPVLGEGFTPTHQQPQRHPPTCTANSKPDHQIRRHPTNTQDQSLQEFHHELSCSFYPRASSPGRRTHRWRTKSHEGHKRNHDHKQPHHTRVASRRTKFETLFAPLTYCPHLQVVKTEKKIERRPLHCERNSKHSHEYFQLSAPLPASPHPYLSNLLPPPTFWGMKGDNEIGWPRLHHLSDQDQHCFETYSSRQRYPATPTRCHLGTGRTTRA